MNGRRAVTTIQTGLVHSVAFVAWGVFGLQLLAQLSLSTTLSPSVLPLWPRSVHAFCLEGVFQPCQRAPRDGPEDLPHSFEHPAVSSCGSRVLHTEESIFAFPWAPTLRRALAPGQVSRFFPRTWGSTERRPLQGPEGPSWLEYRVQNTPQAPIVGTASLLLERRQSYFSCSSDEGVS